MFQKKLCKIAARETLTANSQTINPDKKTGRPLHLFWVAGGSDQQGAALLGAQ